MLPHTHVITDQLNETSLGSTWVHFTVKSLIEKHGHLEEFTVFVVMYLENKADLNVTGVSNLIRALREIRPRWKLFLIYDTYYHHKVQQNHFDVQDMLSIDYCLYWTVRKCKVHNISSAAIEWPAQQKKFLCLTGKPYKLNRIGLLYKLHQQGLLNKNRCVWSLLPDHPAMSAKAEKNRFIHHFALLTHDEITQFFADFECNPDSVDLVSWRPGDSTDEVIRHYDSYRYDVDLYASTSFSVVSETRFRSSEIPEITEKTWRAILNHHPFIIAGDVHTCQSLNKMGFFTYEKFMPYAHYDRIEDNLDRLEKIVQNVAYWADHINDYAEEIRVMTRDNQLLLLKHYESNEQRIKCFLQRNNLELDLDEIVLNDTNQNLYQSYTWRSETSLGDEHFSRFYNDVRDPSWPDCASEQQFHDLPLHIKQELITVFGYTYPGMIKH